MLVVMMLGQFLLVDATVVEGGHCNSVPASFAPELSRNFSLDAARLPGFGSSPTVPVSDRSSGPYCNVTAAGTDVSVQIRFYKVEAVAQTAGHMSFKAWLRYSWKDERLAWDPSEYGGITYHYVRAVADNLWIPDLTIYNSQGGFSGSFEDQLALVSSDGSVSWSRPGTVSLLCKFSGLVR